LASTLRERHQRGRQAPVRVGTPAAAGARERGSGRRLPAAPDAVEANLSEGPGERSKVATGTVLLVEDEPSMRLLCRVNLELAGFAVIEAENGAEGLESARTPGIDLVLLDVMLPDIGGHEVARRLAERPAPAVVFLSARASSDDLRIGYQVGAVDYITKPFDPLALSTRVSEILGRIRRGESEQYRLARLAELEG
jgi:CheY-like chemotaxis protein